MNRDMKIGNAFAALNQWAFRWELYGLAKWAGDRALSYHCCAMRIKREDAETAINRIMRPDWDYHQ